MLSGVSFMGMTALKAAEKTILLQKMESLTQTTRSLQIALSGWWVGPTPPDELRSLMETAAIGMGITSFHVVDGKGRTLANIKGEGYGLSTSNPYLKRAVESKGIVMPDQLTGELPKTAEGSWSFAAPIFSEEGFAGAFVVSFPLEPLGVALKVHRKIIFSFALLDALVIVLFGVWLIGKVAIQPLVRISKGAEAFASGEYDTRVDEKGTREIASLAASFNEMAQRVQAAVQKQEEHLTALEKANMELKAAQAEMLRVEKLASIGRLSAGVAHEIGNPLSAILGYASILLSEEKDPESTEYLTYIEKETERIQRIIGGLLEFARPGEVVMEEVDLNGLIISTLELITPQDIFKQVEVKTDLAMDLPYVKADRYQLQQAIINVLINSGQAMEGSGYMSVSTHTRKLPPNEGMAPTKRSTDVSEKDYMSMRSDGGRTHVIHPGDNIVSLIIEDSGPGVEPEVLEKVFDPFFTTKDTGKGTGLGLSISFGIIQAHGGSLDIENVEGGGARVVIDLPAAL